MKNFLIPFIVCISCNSSHQETDSSISLWNRVVVYGGMDLQSTVDESAHGQIQEIVIKGKNKYELNDLSASVLKKVKCSLLRIEADTINVTVKTAIIDSLKILSFRTKKLSVQSHISKCFPSLYNLEIYSQYPFMSNLFNQKLHVQTLLIYGFFESTKPLAESNISGMQLTLMSPLLTELDSLYANELKFGIIDITNSPLGQRLNSLCPEHGCNERFGINDTIVLGY
ncbi:MAG: hypothetical protein WA937_08790 [Flavobacteriales bacterium]